MAVRAQRAGGIWRLAPLTLVPAAAFAVHQLRYSLAYGSRASAELQIQGHSYLHSVAPWIVVLIALWVGVFLRALGRAFGGQYSFSRLTVSFAGLWLVCAGSLVGIYAFQEFLEGLLLAGHPAGLVGIFGYGGWWAIPASGAVGLVLAAVFHGAGWVLKEVAERYCRELPPTQHRPTTTPLPRAVLVPAPAPLADGWSGRGPPGPRF
jgi:hypothetical protein